MFINKNIYIAIIISVGLIPRGAHSVELKQRQLGDPLYTDNVATTYSEEVPGTAGMDEMTVVQTLRHDIQLLDEEIMQCERKRKGWVAATVVGGVGALSTGIAALVQHDNIQDKKSELQRIQSDIESTKQGIRDASSNQ